MKKNQYIDDKSSGIMNIRRNLQGIGVNYLTKDKVERFVISGSANYGDMYEPLLPFLEKNIGQTPIIIIRNGKKDDYIEQLVYSIWRNKIGGDQKSEEEYPVYIFNNGKKDYEPLWGFSPNEIVSTLRYLAKRMNYTIGPSFDKVVLSHIAILNYMDVPVSLTEFHYLCQFTDIGRFYENIMDLPCSKEESERVWANLCINQQDNSFEIFRSVINHLAFEAEHNNWMNDGDYTELNFIHGVQKKSTIIFSLNDRYDELFLPYLMHELRSIQTPFTLLIDDVKLEDDFSLNYILKYSEGVVGIVANHIMNVIPDENTVYKYAEIVDLFIFLKHRTSYLTKLYSEIIGRIDYVKEEHSEGTSKGAFDILAKDKHMDTRYSIENRYKVRPEQFLELSFGQSIIFDTSTNRVLFTK